MKRTMLTNVADIACLIMMIGSTAYLFAHWSTLPDRVPIHYGWTGKANGWIGKEYAWINPCVMWGIFVIISIVECFPRLWNTGGIKITDGNRDRIYTLIRNLISTTKILAVLLLSVFVVDSAHGGGAVPSSLFVAIPSLIVVNVAFWWVKMFMNRS